MKITKFVHSCLLVEDGDQVVLFDPGQFSWESGLFKLEDLRKLDYIVITHEHFDHFHLPFVQALVAKFPDAKIITTPSVAQKLKEENTQHVSTESSGPVIIFSNKPHAHLGPLGPGPENIAVHFADRLTVGGDRHDLEETKEILALTVIAPWGSMLDAADMALKLQPKIIFPVHDWHWNETARSQAYDKLESLFLDKGMTFLKPQDGIAIEV